MAIISLTDTQPPPVLWLLPVQGTIIGTPN